MTDTNKSTRVSGWKAREYVQKLQPFHNSNKQLYGKWVRFTAHDDGPRYVVYSYGAHWPLYIHCNGKWYGNAGKTSRTKTRHASQTHPLQDIIWLTTRDMIVLAERGITTLTANRVL